MNVLLKYLKAKDDGEWGWIRKYELEVTRSYDGEGAKERNWAYLSGHYNSILDQLIDAVGIDRIRTLAYSMVEIDKAVHEYATKAAGEQE